MVTARQAILRLNYEAWRKSKSLRQRWKFLGCRLTGNTGHLHRKSGRENGHPATRRGTAPWRGSNWPKKINHRFYESGPFWKTKYRVLPNGRVYFHPNTENADLGAASSAPPARRQRSLSRGWEGRKEENVENINCLFLLTPIISINPTLSAHLVTVAAES